MTERKEPKTVVISLILATLIVLAGCTSTSQPLPPPGGGENIESASATPSTSATPTSEPESSPELSSASESQNSLNLTSEEKERIAKTIANFYEKLPDNDTERRVDGLEAAGKICSFDRKFNSVVNTSDLKNGSSTAGDATRRMEFAAQIVREKFNDEVPLDPFDDLDNGVSKVSKYAPLVGSYNRLADRACVANETRTDESLEEFYVAALVFGVDVVLVSTGAFHQPAFAGTRYVTNRASSVGLYRLRYLCGDRCWALGMSEIYAAIRGSMLGSVNYVITEGSEQGLDITRGDIDWVEIAKLQGANPQVLLNPAAVNTSRCGSSVGERANDLEGAINTSNPSGIFGDGGLGKSIDSVINESHDVLDECSNADG